MKKKSLLEQPPRMNELLSEMSKQPEVAPLKSDKRNQRNAGRECQFTIRVTPSFRDEYESVKNRDRLLNRWHWAVVAMKAYEALPKEERERLIAEVIADDPAMQQFPDLKR